mmetsp:Transcript_25516/g.58919  ORF Transcript_25516/g.58919 Transcript_25516/m.58919 type:complete len:468 (+) Transcript_25516:101-1504(+)
MGNAQRSGPSIPDTDRATYFHELLVMGWIELLCCPAAMGCTILNFKPSKKGGGDPHYRVKLRLSHNEHVPRYQVHMVKHGKTKQWIVGHLEKTQTHLRTKPGEFMRVQVWKIVCNAMTFPATDEKDMGKSLLRGSKKPQPSAVDMKVMNMIAVLQGKMVVTDKGETGEPTPVPGTEIFSHTLSVDDPAFRMVFQRPSSGNGDTTPGEGAGARMRSRRMSQSNIQASSPDEASVLIILNGSKRVCVAKKQYFSRSLGQISQPFLGVQIRPETEAKTEAADAQPDEDEISSLLNVDGLMLLCMCLAWSEEVMIQSVDASHKFLEAMKLPDSDKGSAKNRGLATGWKTEDMVKRLEHMPFFKYHTWKDEADGEEGGSDSDEEGDEEESESSSGSGMSGAKSMSKSMSKSHSRRSGRASSHQGGAQPSALKAQKSDGPDDATRPKTPVRFHGIDISADLKTATTSKQTVQT